MVQHCRGKLQYGTLICLARTLRENCSVSWFSPDACLVPPVRSMKLVGHFLSARHDKKTNVRRLVTRRFISSTRQRVEDRSGIRDTQCAVVPALCVESCQRY